MNMNLPSNRFGASFNVSATNLLAMNNHAANWLN
jgi:hypothetical protein